MSYFVNNLLYDPRTSMILNLQAHAEQSRARASLHDGCQCWRY